MARALPPLTWFRSFEAAARTLSFTAAAEEIGLTQSAVSQQVKSLEHRLGVTLFLRGARRLALTDEGRKLLPQVAASLEQLTVAASAFEGSLLSDVLTIATSVSIAQWVISPNLRSFVNRHPGTRVRILNAVWPDDFRTSRADVQIQFGSQKQAGPDGLLLEPNRLVPMRSSRIKGQFSDLPIIETVGTSAGWKAWQAVHGPVPNPAHFCDNYGMALQMAAHGNGIALVSEVLAANAFVDGRLERAHNGSIPANEGYFVSITQANPLATGFMEWLLEHLDRTSAAFSSV